MYYELELCLAVLAEIMFLGGLTYNDFLVLNSLAN